MKVCSKCQVSKSEDDFYKNVSYCKPCRKRQIQEYNIRNADVIREKRRIYDANNAQHLYEYKRDWYSKNYEALIAKSRQRQKDKKEELTEYKQKWFQRTKAKTRAQRSASSKAYKKRNKHIVLWRSLLERWLKAAKQKKIAKTGVMIGYTSQELKTHIERLWTPGMCWGNYGEWHVDHIRPVVSFSPDTESCVVNALSNLRPLWATSRTIDGVFYEGNLNRRRM